MDYKVKEWQKIRPWSKVYNKEIQTFFSTMDKEDSMRILKSYGFTLNQLLKPDDFQQLRKLFPETMAFITNGCKPSYLPSWLQVNKSKIRRCCCNKHDFMYWIGYPRAKADKIFLDDMNRRLDGFFQRQVNKMFYWLVDKFGETAWCSTPKTLEDFFKLGMEK